MKWAADAADTTVRVFGVNKCLSAVQGGKCVSDGMTIPNSDLLLLGSAPTSQAATWQYWMPGGVTYFCGAIGVVAERGQIADRDHFYYAIVLRAERDRQLTVRSGYDDNQWRRDVLTLPIRPALNAQHRSRI